MLYFLLHINIEPFRIIPAHFSKSDDIQNPTKGNAYSSINPEMNGREKNYITAQTDGSTGRPKYLNTNHRRKDVKILINIPTVTFPVHLLMAYVDFAASLSRCHPAPIFHRSLTNYLDY